MIRLCSLLPVMYCVMICLPGEGGGGEGKGWEVLPEKLVGCVWPPSQNPYPIMTEISHFPYPIYDLTKNVIPYL